jgi:nucleotide-binding universal stress UspA family protein
MTITRILCPVDFSEASAHAVDLATAIAGWYKARIAALYVASAIEAALPGFELPSGGSLDRAGLERLRAKTAALFPAASGAGIGVDVFVDEGAPPRRILERAVDLPADLIVMGTHGSGGFERFVLGSVTEKVLRKAACPVLTVPPRAHATSQIPFTRLLCAIDFSDSSIGALRHALSLAEEADARLTILHVIEWPWEEPPAPRFEGLPPEQAAALADFRRYCETSASKRLDTLVPASFGGSHHPVTQVRNGKAYAQILDVAASEGSDLIVVGVRGRNPLDMTLFGSTANHVVRRAACPVLTLRH